MWADNCCQDTHLLCPEVLSRWPVTAYDWFWTGVVGQDGLESLIKGTQELNNNLLIDPQQYAS